jgi:hypothetical protein
MPADTHPCAADQCDVPLPPRLLMCGPHWRDVPRVIQARIYALYRPGQTAATASPEYLAVLDEAVAAVRESEARRG